MIDAETIFRKGCKCEAAQNRGVKQVEIYPREGTETTTISNLRQLKSVEIYPREGTETVCSERD